MILRQHHRILVQGITGKQGTFWTEAMIKFGATVVGGVNPRKAGTEHLGLPVFASAKEAAEIGLVDRAVADAELDATVDALTAEICRNSAGTNRRVKQLIASNDTMKRDEALAHERTMPFGIPEDMHERMAR